MSAVRERYAGARPLPSASSSFDHPNAMCLTPPATALPVCAQEGVPAHVFADAATSRELSFRYAEPAPGLAWLLGSVSALRSYPPSRWVSGPSLLRADSSTQAILRGVLQRLTPPNALVTLTAKELSPQAPYTEPIYGARYGTLPIADEIQHWAEAPRVAGLAAPPPNRFLPYKLGLKAAAAPAVASARGASPLGASGLEELPTLLVNIPGVRLHWLPDRTFRRPKAYLAFALRSPALYTSAAVAAQAELYAALLNDHLQDVAFEAGQAGLAFTVGVSHEGLLLQLGGFDQRLPELLELVVRSARTFAIRPAAYKRKLDGLTRNLRSLDKRQPVALCSYYRNLALQVPRYSNVELLNAFEGRSGVEQGAAGGAAGGAARGEALTAAEPSAGTRSERSAGTRSAHRATIGKREVQRFPVSVLAGRRDVSVSVGPKSLVLAYCCWPILIVVLLAMPTVPTLFTVNVHEL